MNNATAFPARRSSAPALPAIIREAAHARYTEMAEAAYLSDEALAVIHTALVAVTFPARYTLAEVSIAARLVGSFAQREASWEDMEAVAAAFILPL